MSRLSKEQVEQYLTIIGENSYPAEAAELRWHIEALDKYNYSQWERGYGDGITGMGAVLAGAPLENLPEANREQARRWIDRHDAELKRKWWQEWRADHDKILAEWHAKWDAVVTERDHFRLALAELKAQTTAMLEKIADGWLEIAELRDEKGDYTLGLKFCAVMLKSAITTDHADALNAMMVAAVDRGFQAGIRDMQQAVEAERAQCALCAEQYPEAESYVCQDIAASIRYRSAASPVSHQEPTADQFVECDCDPEYAHHCFKCGGTGKIRKPVSQRAGAPEREQP